MRTKGLKYNVRATCWLVGGWRNWWRTVGGMVLYPRNDPKAGFRILNDEFLDLRSAETVPTCTSRFSLTLSRHSAL